jgi:hypothetical protein
VSQSIANSTAEAMRTVAISPSQSRRRLAGRRACLPYLSARLISAIRIFQLSTLREARLEGRGLGVWGPGPRLWISHRADEPTRRIADLPQPKRPGANAEMSIAGRRPAMRSATIFPVIGAAVIPTWPWPKA